MTGVQTCALPILLLDQRQFGVVVDPIEAKRVPQNEYDAKFSAPYAVATALCRGRFGLAELEDAARLDKDVLALAQRISCAHDERSRYPDAFSGGLKLRLRDGTELARFEPVNQGAEGQLLSIEQVRGKFFENCALTIPSAAAQQLWSATLGLDEMNDVTEFMSLLRTRASGT